MSSVDDVRNIIIEDLKTLPDFVFWWNELTDDEKEVFQDSVSFVLDCLVNRGTLRINTVNTERPYVCISYGYMGIERN